MTSHQEHAGKSATHESGKPADNAEEASSAPSKSELLRVKLKLVARYALLGFAPVVAVVALVIAIIAVSSSRASHEQLDKTAAKLNDLNTSLSAAKSEVDKLKLAMLKDKSQQNEEIAQQGEQIDKIIRNLTPLQVKLKISPTLEEQLRQPVSAPASAPVAAAPHAAEVAPAPKKSAEPVAAEKKMSPQVRALKEAIEQYNKK